MSATDGLAPNAHALSAFRGLPRNGCRAYTATWFPGDPWGGVERVIRTARMLGFIGSYDYAVLDVLDENGDIVQDFGIPTAEAFRWFKRHLKLAVASEDRAA